MLHTVLVLIAKAVVKSGAERLMDVSGARFDSAVHKEIADALRGKDQVFHDVSVVHRAASLNKIVKLGKQLLIAVYKLLYLLLQSGIGQLVHSQVALSHQKFGVAERVFDIEQLFRRHILSLQSY